jgi:hypothetical protein
MGCKIGALSVVGAGSGFCVSRKVDCGGAPWAGAKVGCGSERYVLGAGLA